MQLSGVSRCKQRRSRLRWTEVPLPSRPWSYFCIGHFQSQSGLSRTFTGRQMCFKTSVATVLLMCVTNERLLCFRFAPWVFFIPVRSHLANCPHPGPVPRHHLVVISLGRFNGYGLETPPLGRPLGESLYYRKTSASPETDL